MVVIGWSFRTKRPTNDYDRYHAHVYFDETSVGRATEMCEKIAADKRFAGVEVGRVHQKLVGPHPRWSCQLAFDRAQFDKLIEWLKKNRKGLTILVHGLTGNDLADHTEHSSWLGHAVPLDLSVFSD
ncbi:MAG: DOPA 4,5-dioxygenase family protein [Cyanobacteria bacterium J06641_5]